MKTAILPHPLLLHTHTPPGAEHKPSSLRDTFQPSDHLDGSILSSPALINTLPLQGLHNWRQNSRCDITSAKQRRITTSLDLGIV